MTKLSLKTRSSIFVTLVSLLISSSPMQAGDIVFGLGTTDFDEASVGLGELEYHSDPFARVLGADISWTGTLIAHDNGDVFLGAGLSAVRPISGQWFLEGSFSPGVFHNTSEATELGSELQFRTLVGVGRSIGSGRRISLGLSHKSNANLGTTNPGVNALTVRFRQSF